jgi:triosephosphate isomerase (TIM)
MVCAASRKEAAIVAKFRPDYIAVEPPELIGTGISVSTANPQIIKNSVAAVKKIGGRMPVVCGAGITNGDDVKKAIMLGSKGALAASGVVLARSQEAALRELVRLI